MILFTTGRGTPLGTAVPTLKVATNNSLAKRKSKWIDFNAGYMLEHDQTDELFEMILCVANGGKTKNEISGYEEIAIFKSGVIL